MVMGPRFRYILAWMLAMMISLAAWGAPKAVADKPFTVVLDPGHGGKDAGAVGRNTKEKDVVLAVAIKLRDKIQNAHPNVKVLLTRDDDTFIGLQQRADIANKGGGDLFISLHCNSVAKKNPRRNLVEGVSVYAPGVAPSENSLLVAQRENAVMELEPDFTTKYEGFDPEMPESYIMFDFDNDRHQMQSLDFAAKAQTCLVRDAGRFNADVRQAGFWVLKATSMPAVLVELDFICNPIIEQYLASEEGQQQLADALTTAFTQYKEGYDRLSQLDSKVPANDLRTDPVTTQPKPYVPEAKDKRKPKKHKN